jgi:L-2-hydroxyglutarate oxidase LhgO
MNDPVSGPAKTAKTDAVLVGVGIMSATLGALLRRLEPGWSITLVERLDGAAAESSAPWNNAGTGHAGLCEVDLMTAPHLLMTAPHLDARIVNGRPWLLFGPFAGWSSKFLKHGRVSDLPRSVKPNNLLSLVNAGGIGHA